MLTRLSQLRVADLDDDDDDDDDDNGEADAMSDHDGDARMEDFYANPDELDRGVGPVPSKMPQACIFVANLAAGKSEDELFQSCFKHFKKWGEISEIKLDRDTANRPYAFIQFVRIRDAKVALSEAQGTVVDERPIRVEPAKVIRTLRVKFSPSYPLSQVEADFSSFGHIEDFQPLRYRDTGEPKGVAYVKFFSRADAIRAFLDLRKRPRWSIEWAKQQDRNTELDKKSLFIGKLNKDTITEDLLHDKFSPYGEIERIQLFNHTNSKHAFAFVRYASDNDAELAIDELHGSRWLDHIIKVQYREVQAGRHVGSDVQAHFQRSMSFNSIPLNPAAEEFYYPQSNAGHPSGVPNSSSFDARTSHVHPPQFHPAFIQWNHSFPQPPVYPNASSFAPTFQSTLPSHQQPSTFPAIPVAFGHGAGPYQIPPGWQLVMVPPGFLPPPPPQPQHLPAQTVRSPSQMQQGYLQDPDQRNNL
ncbi:hypothetical protein BC830DRAFT_1170920 [Chytriomyces sp. MP71]|nr:hypothetical protein BC830DRAFT_1170920 [Chytriomyces sp. MP71]